MPVHQLLSDKVFVFALILSNLFSISVKGLETSIDFIICLGGDGTLLYAASLFQVCVFCTAGNEKHATMLYCRHYSITYVLGCYIACSKCLALCA